MTLVACLAQPRNLCKSAEEAMSANPSKHVVLAQLAIACTDMHSCWAAGIGQPTGSKTVIDWVLQGFTGPDQEEISFALEDAMTTVQAVFVLGFEKALSGQRVTR